MKAKTVGASRDRPLFSFALTEKLTQNVGISFGLYAVILDRFPGASRDAPTLDARR